MNKELHRVRSLQRPVHSNLGAIWKVTRPNIYWALMPTCTDHSPGSARQTSDCSSQCEIASGLVSDGSEANDKDQNGETYTCQV
jgi:hypothetical protein